MTTYDRDGNMTSTFSPPTDKHGRALSYAEWRDREGIPIGPEEAAARAKVRRLSDELRARFPGIGAVPLEEYRPLWLLRMIATAT